MNSSPDSMRFIFITANPAEAKIVAEAGVDIIMVDLEIHGKDERQANLNTVISRHTPQDISDVAQAIKGTHAQLMVRLNPLHSGSKAEIDDAVARGAQRLMLPMFRSANQVAEFIDLVHDRVPVTLLLETATALGRLRAILKLDGDYDLHIGLNDLHLELKLDFMFELLTGGLVDYVASSCKGANRKFGIGGVARLDGEGALAPRDILNEHINLGSNAVILSRDWNAALVQNNFADEIKKMRSYIASPHPRDHEATNKVITNIANNIVNSAGIGKSCDI